MNISKDIKNSLQSLYKIGFDIFYKYENAIDKYVINPTNSEDKYFKLCIEIKEDTRLTIVSEPEKYGASFVKSLNKSNNEQRRNFVSYCETISKNGRLSIRINEMEINFRDIINDASVWKKFQIRFTKSPYYDDENNKADVVIDYVSMVCGMILSLLTYDIEGEEEGSVVIEKSKKYERSSLNRKLCISMKGYKCNICGFEFKSKYNNIGNEYIEIHHVKPVSLMEEEYKVNIDKDLIPICSNCHSMIHRKYPPYSPEELKNLLVKE